MKMRIATAEDALDIVALRAAVAAKLTAQYGRGPWSGVSTEKGVLFDLRTSKVFVAHQKSRLCPMWYPRCWESLVSRMSIGIL